MSEQLRELRVPVLYLQASEDRVVPRAASELVARLAPRCQVVELSGPHFLLQAVPSMAAKVVGEFCREVALTSNGGLGSDERETDSRQSRR